MGLLELLAIILLLSWVGGFAFQVGGNLIHVLLVLAIIVFAMRFFRRTVV